ncbi:MAG: transketolase C-terminal domain-containing protein, partial [Oscillospiraceae bacterium]
KGIRITDCKDASIVACGVMVAYAVEAAKQLEKEGIHVTVVDMHTIKPLDKELVEKLALESGKIVTVEDQHDRRSGRRRVRGRS